MSWLNSLQNGWNAVVPAPIRNALGQAETLASEAPGAIKGEVTGWVDQLRLGHGGMPKGPFPSIASLQAKFPKAGLPAKMVGTTIDNAALAEPGATPDSVMAKCKAMGMNTVRLGAYWDEIEPNGPNQDDFKQLDALLAAANKYGIKVVLTVGAKAPNWPEYHFPKWAAPSSLSNPSQDPNFRKNAAAFVTKVAQHVANNPAICMWQVENEPLDPAGPNRGVESATMVADEIKILQASDQHRRPVMINCWSAGDRKGQIDEAFKLADVVGLDVYGPAPSNVGSYERTVGIPAYALQQSKKTGKPAMIAELQADDWGSYQANGADVTKLTQSLQKMGYSDILFWRLRQNLEDDRNGPSGLTQAETKLADQALGTPNA